MCEGVGAEAAEQAEGTEPSMETRGDTMGEPAGAVATELRRLAMAG